MSFTYFLYVWILYLSRSQSLIKLSRVSYFEKISLKLSLFFLIYSCKAPFLVSSWKPVLKELVFKKLSISISAKLCLLFLVF